MPCPPCETVIAQSRIFVKINKKWMLQWQNHLSKGTFGNWNNFLLTPAMNTTHVSKLQSLPTDCDCSASIFCTILAKVKIFQCWKYSCNRPPRVLKQLSSNIRNKVNSNKFHEVSTTPILLRCDCLKLAFSIKMAKMNTSLVKILPQ